MCDGVNFFMLFVTVIMHVVFFVIFFVNSNSMVQVGKMFLVHFFFLIFTLKFTIKIS